MCNCNYDSGRTQGPVADITDCIKAERLEAEGGGQICEELPSLPSRKTLHTHPEAGDPGIGGIQPQDTPGL